MRRCVSSEVAVAVLLVAGCGDNASEPGEPCNGIDDNRDGMVDEGCPCRAFSIELPVMIDPMLVSLGAGWATIARSDSSASYVRLDDDGKVVAMMPIGDLASTGRHRSLAWDGSRLAYLGGTDDTHLAFLTVDGQDSGHGPSLGVPSNVDRLIAVTPNGYDAAFRPPGGLPPLFVSVDRSGELETLIDSHSPAPAGAFDLVERSDGAVLAWSYHASNFGDDCRIGPPWQGIRYGGQPTIFGDAASDGTNVLAVGTSPVSAYDGKTVTEVSGVPGTPVAVTWTGRAWQIVTLDGGDIDLVTLDASLSVTATERIFTIPPTGGAPGYLTSAEVSGDARRILVSFQYVATRAPQQQLIQLCR